MKHSVSWALLCHWARWQAGVTRKWLWDNVYILYCGCSSADWCAVFDYSAGVKSPDCSKENVFQLGLGTVSVGVSGMFPLRLAVVNCRFWKIKFRIPAAGAVYRMFCITCIPHPVWMLPTHYSTTSPSLPPIDGHCKWQCSYYDPSNHSF